MKRKRMIIQVLLVLCFVASKVHAQQDSVVFVPHWYVQPMPGVGLHIGEDGLGHRISPAVQLSIGRQFSPLWGVRLSAVGWEARNTLAWPAGSYYKWNYALGTIDVTLSLTDLILGYNWSRRFDAYALAGGGMALAWNNDEAQALSAHYLGFDKRWSGTRSFLAARCGVGFSYRVSDRIAVQLEGNASMLPDHFNSKVGKHGSRDWQMNVLAGVKIALGPTMIRVARPVPPPPPPVIKPDSVVIREPEPVKMPEPQPVEKPKPIEVDVYYRINSVTINDAQRAKLDSLVTYVMDNPATIVLITGYADRQTGTPAYNLQISKRRADTVYRYLRQKGIAADRMQVDAVGDKQQPRPTIQENRVVICVIKE